ncbi:MAG: A/G-specific adenine glycosylase [Balneolaceae bacterium]
MKSSPHSKHFPARELLHWFEQQGRKLPWRETKNPYAVWISEIMLQQTRVDTVIPYFERFISEFPTVAELAEASRQDLLRCWEGLGYYSRARNLQDAARELVTAHDGKIPATYEELIRLKGIGPYTAAAISSISFGEPRAAVDGNVIRVLSRYFQIEEDIRKSGTRREIQSLADAVLAPERPGDFNQALMELGATVCRPSSPDCSSCPLKAHCLSYRTASTDRIPYKSKVTPVPHHQIAVGIIFNPENQVLIALRPEDAMLGGLWEFPGGKQTEGETLRQTVDRELREELGISVSVGEKFMELDHAYSHFKITLHAYLCSVQDSTDTPEPKSSTELRWVEIPQLDKFPFPKANRRLTEKLIRRYPAP